MAVKDMYVVVGLTALAGGANSASTTVLAGDVNVLATVATAGDSGKLIAGCATGASIKVRNNGAASANVFPPTGGTIDGAAVDTAKAVAAAKAMEFLCVGGNGLTWVTLAGA